MIRGGSGLYWDSDIGSSRIAERRVLGPSGNGRVVVQGSGIANPLFGQAGQPLTLTPSPALPTALNGQQVMNLIPQIKASEEARFGRLGDLSLQNIQRLKANDTQPIFSHDTRTPYTIHVTFGGQREIVSNMTVTADFTCGAESLLAGHTLYLTWTLTTSTRRVRIRRLTKLPKLSLLFATQSFLTAQCRGIPPRVSVEGMTRVSNVPLGPSASSNRPPIHGMWACISNLISGSLTATSSPPPTPFPGTTPGTGLPT